MISNELDKGNMEQQEGIPSDAHRNQLFVQPELEEPWFRSLGRSLREVFNPAKVAPLELTSRPVEGATMGGLDQVEQPWYKSLIANIKDAINPPKLEPLQVTSQPVEVQSIWGAYGGGQSRSAAVSVGVHIAALALILLIFQARPVQQMVKKVVDVYYVPPYKPKAPMSPEKAGGGGGGGMHQVIPVSHGAAPKFAPKPFIPPTITVPKPKLPAPPAITAVVPQIQADNYGDPLSKIMPNSGGPGANGLGAGSGGGLGSGNGDGYGPGSGGNQGGGVYRPGGDVSAPQILSKVEPEYSEEARKAKYSGTVMLSIVVDEHGLPRDIKVIRPLGLGLDEKAIEAVAHWRFRPGMKAGRAVATQATVEVNFRLL